MAWSPQQEQALKAMKTWLISPSSPQVFRLFGFAGCGKSTLAKEVATFVKGHILYAAFTGKAALVLRKKGCGQASTIHSLIYKASRSDSTGELEFEINEESEVREVKLVVIDEVSMVDEVLGLDLLYFGIKILVLGDPAQLPPVKGTGFFINARPDFMLTEIHRQALDNPIIRMSMDIREGRRLQFGQFGDCRVARAGEIPRDEMAIIAMQANQILCGKNKTRHVMNNRIRTLQDKGGIHCLDKTVFKYPVAGDRLVCLKNDRKKGLLNGGLWEAVHVDLLAQYAAMVIRSLDEPHSGYVEVDVLYQFFEGTEGDLSWQTKKDYDEFTYGYALTVHKSQGSQFDDVLLFDESYAFGENSRKHLYTGITRAAEKITVIV
ncbi:ATP-dependent DNA helicase [Polynucleobacter sp.]|uniref:ATP-dependent DNA helicase n=1 Tax=Polynucleobacter sp. TaxID=2029855 RepID=UPI003F6A2506